MAKKNNLTYTEATERLNAIIRETESGALDIDQLTTKLKEAQELLAFCQDKLLATDNEVRKLLQENTTDEQE